MYCFKCKNIVMKKMSYYDVIIDVCERCGGVWLDKNEMSLIVANYVNKSVDIDAKSYITKMNIDIEKILEKKNVPFSCKQCPKCVNNSMKKIMWNDMELDVCSKCCGIFFNGREFPQAMNIYLKNRGFFSKVIMFIKEKIFRIKYIKI